MQNKTLAEEKAIKKIIQLNSNTQESRKQILKLAEVKGVIANRYSQKDYKSLVNIIHSLQKEFKAINNCSIEKQKQLNEKYECYNLKITEYFILKQNNKRQTDQNQHFKSNIVNGYEGINQNHENIKKNPQEVDTLLARTNKQYEGQSQSDLIRIISLIKSKISEQPNSYQKVQIDNLYPNTQIVVKADPKKLQQLWAKKKRGELNGSVDFRKTKSSKFNNEEQLCELKMGKKISEPSGNRSLSKRENKFHENKSINPLSWPFNKGVDNQSYLSKLK